MKAYWILLGIGAAIVLTKGKEIISGVSDTIIEKMADAITYWESGGDSGSISYQNNNPGNLKPVGFTYTGQTGVDSYGHAIFSTYTAGRAALEKQLRLAFNNKSNVYSSAMTLYEFFSKYAEANSGNYAEYVAAQLGVSADTTLDTLMG